MDILEQLRRDEGVRYEAYRDSLGNLTFGTGFTFPIDEAENSFILQHRADLVYAQLMEFGWFQKLDPVRQGVLENMGYNLGVAKLLHFVHFLAALDKLDYQTAAQEMLNSNWAIQVGDRAKRLAQQMVSGEWV
jgi:lysozyme